jgi:CheY-like chemotaxis protein
MAQKRQKVLFLDDDANFLEMFQNVMQSYAADSWDIHVAKNAGEALGIIQDKQIDLVVVDIHMPVIDGMQFLTLLNRKHPNVIKVVLSGGASEEERAKCLSLGAELVLDKAETKESWQSVYATINELARHQPDEGGFRGVLRRVSLQDVLQMECLSRSSAVLELSTKELTGSIFIHEGQIIHAQMGDRTGEDAFNAVLALTGGQFNLKPFREPPQRTISSSWEFLLMEAARMRDEGAEDAAASEAGTPQPGRPIPTPRETQFFQKLPPSATGAVSGTPGARPGASPEGPELRPEIAEMLVCSVQGDVLYEWQCPDSSARVSFFEFLSQKARQLSAALPLGQFERIEMCAPKSRVTAQIGNEHAIFVRANLR